MHLFKGCERVVLAILSGKKKNGVAWKRVGLDSREQGGTPISATVTGVRYAIRILSGEHHTGFQWHLIAS